MHLLALEKASAACLMPGLPPGTSGGSRCEHDSALSLRRLQACKLSLIKCPQHLGGPEFVKRMRAEHDCKPWKLAMYEEHCDQAICSTAVYCLALCRAAVQQEQLEQHSVLKIELRR